MAAIDQLRGALIVIDKSKEPPARVLDTVREIVGDAIAVMQEPEPLTRSCMFALLLVAESTEIEEHTDNKGRTHEIVKVKDRALYELGMKRVHELARADLR